LANEELSRDETGTFGTKPTKVDIPYDFHERVYRTYKENKTFHPNPELENFDLTDLQTACIYNCANAFAMRGQSEHHNLKWSYITFGIVNYQDIASTNQPEMWKHLIGRSYMAIDYKGERKRQRLSYKNQTYDRNALRQQYISNPDDELDCVLFFQKLKYLCHDKQPYVYHNLASTKLQHTYKKEFGRDIIFDHTKRLAANKITGRLQILAKLCGVPNWHKINNHLFRGERITNLVNNQNVNMVTYLGIAGHASIGSQKPYVKSKFSQTIAASANLHKSRIINED
jgi:hypothetical protein